MQIEGNKRAHKQVWATNIKHWVKTEKLKRPWLVQRRALIQSRPLTYKQFKKHKLKSLEWPSPLSKNIPELEVICKEKDENSQKLSGSSGGVFLLIIAHSSIHCSCTPTWCFSASVCATTSAGCSPLASCPVTAGIGSSSLYDPELDKQNSDKGTLHHLLTRDRDVNWGKNDNTNILKS